MLQSKPFVKYVSLYQSRVLLDKYRGYVEVYTENMAEQMSRMKHLLSMVPPGRVSQLSYTCSSLVIVCLDRCSFLLSHPQSKAAQRATHVLRKQHFQKPFSWAVFSNQVSSPSNSFSERMSFQLHLYTVLSPWKAELTRKTTSRGCLDHVAVLKPRRRHGGTAQKPAAPAYSNICSYSHLINC